MFSLHCMCWFNAECYVPRHIFSTQLSKHDPKQPDQLLAYVTIEHACAIFICFQSCFTRVPCSLPYWLQSNYTQDSSSLFLSPSGGRISVMHSHKNLQPGVSYGYFDFKNSVVWNRKEKSLWWSDWCGDRIVAVTVQKPLFRSWWCALATE